jgi:hypothetical protein
MSPDRDPDPEPDPSGIDARQPDDLVAQGPQGLPGPRVAYAANWKLVLGVDAAMGLIVVMAGLVAFVVWSVWLGAFLLAVGCAYTAMVAVRGDRWRRWRRDAGL